MNREIEILVDNIDELKELVLALSNESGGGTMLRRFALEKAQKVSRLLVNYGVELPNAAPSLVDPIQEEYRSVVVEAAPVVEIVEVLPTAKVRVDLEQTFSQKVEQKADETVIEDRILGEKLQSTVGAETLHERLGGGSAENIREMLALNDRFLLLRELFGGNVVLMEQTLDDVNRLNSYDESIALLNSRFDWELQKEEVQYFFKLIAQRFRR